jgi:thiol-disulfide isomerase/thioredoxin
MLIKILFATTLTWSIAWTTRATAAGPDVKALQFSIRKLDSLQGLMVEFSPPPGHHFNMEAPTEVRLTVGKKITKATLDKAPETIKASWDQKSNSCEILAQLYICDEKNTYCVPIKKTFACQKLTYDNVMSTAANDVGVVTNATEKTKVEKPSPATGSKIEKIFILNDSPKAFAQAKSQNKMVMIDFFGIWCPPCNMLDESVFNTKEFQSLEKQYIFLKLDADAPVSWELKAKYNVKGYPTIILANAEGEEVSRIVGSRRAKAFVREMRAALKLKSVSFAQRKIKADSKRDPEAAFEMAELAFGQEDFSLAMKYFMIGMKKGRLNDERKQKLISSEIGLMTETNDPATKKRLAALIESSLEVYPYGIEALERADQLSRLSEDLKDDSMKNRALNAEFKNAEYLLKNPKLFAEAELTDADLYVVLADVYANLKDEAKMKENYGKAYDAYTRQIQDLKLDINTERGNNLERIYSLYKSGRGDEANVLYENMQKLYPEEFTFYYSQASLLDDVVRLVADLRAKLGKKKEALTLLDETLKSFKAPEEEKVRTHRYLAKLKELKAKIQEKR